MNKVYIVHKGTKKLIGTSLEVPEYSVDLELDPSGNGQFIEDAKPIPFNIDVTDSNWILNQIQYQQECIDANNKDYSFDIFIEGPVVGCECSSCFVQQYKIEMLNIDNTGDIKVTAIIIFNWAIVGDDRLI